MDKIMDNLELIWGNLLSRNPSRILGTYVELSSPEQVAVRKHLKRMAVESGWHPEQRISAQTALEVLEEFSIDDS